MKDHRQVSDICADSAPAAALSNDPNSVVPGRDYRTPQLSEARHEEEKVERGGGVGGGGLRVWVVIKWKEGLTVIWRGG